nr:PREDICTED: protein EVI2B [Anolis carolinensis]|eukprot:XP_008119483.1 PREDICTED: protein EVI2B [Anolis carolinensis]
MMTTMSTNPTILMFFCGQIWWNPIFAETKGAANSSTSTSSPSLIPSVTATETDTIFTTQMHSSQTRTLGGSTKNNRPLSTAKPQKPITEGPKSHNEHVLTAVVIGVTLIIMIAVIVGIFLWKRWRKAASPLPHWAGRSPFADGDVPEVAPDKEVANGLKRVSVLSLLPWKFNKETQLLENADGPLSESRQDLDTASRCDTEESGPTATGNSVSSTSEQTAVSEEPSDMVDVPLQTYSPEPLNLPPPPNWLGGLNGDLGPTQPESLSLEPYAEIHHPMPLDATYQTPSEALLLPPPPDELLSN